MESKLEAKTKKNSTVQININFKILSIKTKLDKRRQDYENKCEIIQAKILPGDRTRWLMAQKIFILYCYSM